MRRSQVLCKQHIQYHFRKHWLVQGKKTLIETGAENNLVQNHGINVIDANEFVKEKKEKIKLQIVGPYDLPVERDEHHPEYKSRACRVMTDANVLVEGCAQAQILLNTVQVSDSLPEAIENSVTEIPSSVHELVKQSILYSHLLDSQQVKLPIVKDPKRPAVNLPRILGICDFRRNELLSNKLINILERTASDRSRKRYTTQNEKTVASFEKDGDLIQLAYPSDILISSDSPLEPVCRDLDILKEKTLPDIYPLTHTISMPKEHFYDFKNSYPLDKNVNSFHPHTIFSYLNLTRTTNLHETAVTRNQIEGKTLMHAFTTAFAYAKAVNGDTETLERPITVQCIHTDSKNYYFGVLQLNTLNMNSNSEVKNVWYAKPPMQLFDVCDYVNGKPTLEGYNPEVFRYLRAIYDR